ncbi:EamA-like transporter family protein [Ciceribacter lividus]|uniref:EamA-like transporter family protein n=1 Tax=Ciceribacter lividus TaxID=1197950 RepID=A0A6I7HSW8_9HYPH|nr:DMT family transporter [Ciceribacter lividus]RCW28253.1 EamA-like transporter family protein [Ciceribacter lividus]
MSRIQANLILLLAAAIWGGGFVAQSSAMDMLGPNWFNGIRFGLAFLAVVPFAWREAKNAARPLAAGDIGAFVVIGAVLFGAQTLQQIGIKTTTVTNASFLTGLYVVLVPAIAVLILRRKPHWIIWPAAALTLVGILLLSGGSLSGLTDGDLLIMVCAVLFAVQITLTPIAVGRSGRPLALAALQFGVCALGGSLGGAILEPITVDAITGSLTEILYAGLLSSGLAFVLQIIGQRYTTAPQAAIFLSSEALFGALFGAILMGDSLPVIGYAGCAIMFAAMLMVELVPELTRRRVATA